MLIDLIFHPTGLELTDEVFERAEIISGPAGETHGRVRVVGAPE